MFEAALARLGSRGPEWSPDTCKAVVGLCAQAIALWPEQFPGRFAASVDRGRRLPGADCDERQEWQQLAVVVCRQAASVDPDWFCQYWRNVVRGGVRPPADVTRLLVELDFLRPPGGRARAAAS